MTKKAQMNRRSILLKASKLVNEIVSDLKSQDIDCIDVINYHDLIRLPDEIANLIMSKAKKRFHVCGFCGKVRAEEGLKWCDRCVDDEIKSIVEQNK